MSFDESVAELRAKFPKADLSPSVVRGDCYNRAVGLDFKRGKGGVYAAVAADGTEVLVYFNDNDQVIACTELPPDEE